MNPNPNAKRPAFDEASKAWRSLLTQRGLPADCLWIFDENLVFEKDTAGPAGFKLGFQTKMTPPPPDAEQIAYDYFGEFGARLVFYRIGSCRGKSVSLVLCDHWFDNKAEADGFVRRDDWGLSFRPGTAEEITEVHDAQRWNNRILRDRPLHDLDFCMTLRAVHEMMAHGYVLSSYERYALKFLHSWRTLLGHQT
jgi:hypothetical protein